MAEEISFENGGISNSEGLVTLTLTFYWVMLHTIIHHSSTSTYMPNFTEIKETFCRQTDVRTHGFIRSTLLKKVDLKHAQHRSDAATETGPSDRKLAANLVHEASATSVSGY